MGWGGIERALLGREGYYLCGIGIWKTQNQVAVSSRAAIVDIKEILRRGKLMVGRGRGARGKRGEVWIAELKSIKGNEPPSY